MTLMDALRKMTLMPAQLLERAASAGQMKGRLQKGKDADLVILIPRRSLIAPPRKRQAMRVSESDTFWLAGLS